MSRRSAAAEGFELRRDNGPVFRRAIIPWYDTNEACWVAICFGLASCVFGGIGMQVVFEEPIDVSHCWLPALLAGLSAALVVSTLLRLFRRRSDI